MPASTTTSCERDSAAAEALLDTATRIAWAPSGVDGPRGNDSSDTIAELPGSS